MFSCLKTLKSSCLIFFGIEFENIIDIQNKYTLKLSSAHPGTQFGHEWVFNLSHASGDAVPLLRSGLPVSKLCIFSLVQGQFCKLAPK